MKYLVDHLEDHFLYFDHMLDEPILSSVKKHAAIDPEDTGMLS